jgi:hypothetical protein
VKLFDYPTSIVEADNAVIFCLDPELIITYCNPAWDQFAIQNGGPELCRPMPVGRCVLDFIGGPDRGYFKKHYDHTLQQSEPWEREYECSSSDVYRKFQMRVLPMQSVRGLFVINSLIVEQAHQLSASPPLEEVYRRADGFILMCGSCRRTRRNSPGIDIWDWVPSFVEDFPARTTHGICAPCKEHYYPDPDE